MKIIEPKNKLVKAGSIPEESAFKKSNGAYFIVLDMQENSFVCSISPYTRERISYDPMWVFNVQTDTLGIFDEDEMVEPVDLEVNVKGK